jgi:hypothetical protein
MGKRKSVRSLTIAALNADSGGIQERMNNDIAAGEIPELWEWSEYF